MAEIVSDQEKEIILNIKLEIDDIKTYYYWFEKKAFLNRPINIIVLVVAALGFIRGRISDVYTNGNLIALMGVVFLLIRGIWRIIYINKTSKKVYESDKIKHKVQIIKITCTTININYGESIVKINWDEIYRVLETEKQFLIFTSINQSLIIPKRFFEKDEDLLSLRDICKDVLPKKKVKLMV